MLGPCDDKKNFAASKVALSELNENDPADGCPNQANRCQDKDERDGDCDGVRPGHERHHVGVQLLAYHLLHRVDVRHVELDILVCLHEI